MSISSISGDGSIDGTLEVHGGYYGASIGGEGVETRYYGDSSPSSTSSGAIIISGGTISETLTTPPGKKSLRLGTLARNS